MSVPARYKDLTLSEFFTVVFRAYPGIKDVVDLFATPGSDEQKALSHYMAKEHWMGMQVIQRGEVYYVTRSSGVRGTAGYEIFLSTMWEVDSTGNNEDNPAISYRLFCDQWYEWIPVPLN